MNCKNCSVDVLSHRLGGLGSPLFGAELVELLTGGLQQPQTTQVPAVGDEEDILRKPERDHRRRVFQLAVHPPLFPADAEQVLQASKLGGVIEWMREQNL